MDLSSALKILKSATAESLKNHQQEVLEILADLGSRLDSIPFLEDQSRREPIDCEYSGSTSEAPGQPGYSSTSESESCESSATSNTSLEAPGSDHSNVVASSQWSHKLLTTISDDIRWLLGYSMGTSTETAIQNKRNKAKDERVADIQHVDGTRTPSNENKIFRAFAQRSMGIEFTQIQRDARLETRVDELFDSICSSEPEAQGRINKRTNFAAKHLDCFRHEPMHRGTVLRGINAGVKRLVMEKLFAQRLRESNRPIEPDGISVLTALKVTAFDRLLYRDIPYFLDQIFRCEVNLSGSPTGDEPKSTSVNLADILVTLSPWVQEFQAKYDEDIFKVTKIPINNGDATSHDGQRPPKRLRLSLQDITMPTHALDDGNIGHSNADTATVPVSSQLEPSRQTVQRIINFPAEVTETAMQPNRPICQGPDDSATSEPALPINHPCSLGNWDKDYGFVPMQNTQTPPAHNFWGTCHPGEDNFARSSAPWGNWDQDYDDASNLQPRRNLTARGPWGNWDQDYDVTSSGVGWTSPSMFCYSN